MSRNYKLGGMRIITDDGIAHRPFDVDGNGLTFVCDLYDHEKKYNELRRVSWNVLVASTQTTCLVCLCSVATEGDEDDPAAWEHAFNKLMVDT